MKTQRPLAVVLGASVGVGASIAEGLANDGYEVIGFYRGRHEPEVPSTTYELIRQDAGSDLDSVKSAVDRLPEGPVQVLVHSLSGAATGSALALTGSKVERTFNSLAHSFLWWVQALYETNRLGLGAHVIALSNPCPDFYLRNSGVIGAAKAALEAYVRMLAVEMDGACFVNAIRFSTVLTPALRQVLGPAAVHTLNELHASIVPCGRMQTADDVAAFVRRHVEDRWTNGAVIDLTGGAPYLLMDYAFNGAR
jgi:NAD(P)-dependent dehydrogenase (short-subunit alcohol dehydrogenase family)